MHGKSQSQMGSRMIFFTDVQFLTIPCELVFNFDKNTYYLCLICYGREKEREGERERWNYLIKETFFREKFQSFFFLDFVTLSLWNAFLTKIMSPPHPVKKSPCRKVCPTNTFSEETLIHVKKSWRMTFY